MEHRQELFQLLTTNGGWFREPTVELRTTEMRIDLGFKYESCVFTKNHSEILGRYQILSEAIAGHKELCEQLGLTNHVRR